MTRQKVDVIPASVRSVQNGGQLKSQSNIRVAAYCRVSTGDESQQTSYTHRKHSTKTSSPGSPAGFLPASTRMKQNLVRTGNIERNSTA